MKSYVLFVNIIYPRIFLKRKRANNFTIKRLQFMSRKNIITNLTEFRIVLKF